MHIISAVAHQGLKELTYALAGHVARARAALPPSEATRVVLRPKALDDTGFTVRRENTSDGELFRVIGERTTRWVRQTDFGNDEAVGYLADRLNRLGVEDALLKAGAVSGSMVLVGPEDNAVVFDWEPTMSAGAEMLGTRGTDVRLDERARPTREEKRGQFRTKMDAAAAARRELAAERQSGPLAGQD